MPTTRIRKKVPLSNKRYREIAEGYMKWLESNFDAPRDRKIKMFDAMCDSAELAEVLNK